MSYKSTAINSITAVAILYFIVTALYSDYVLPPLQNPKGRGPTRSRLSPPPSGEYSVPSHIEMVETSRSPSGPEILATISEEVDTGYVVGSPSQSPGVDVGRHFETTTSPSLSPDFPLPPGLSVGGHFQRTTSALGNVGSPQTQPAQGGVKRSARDVSLEEGEIRDVRVKQEVRGLSLGVSSVIDAHARTGATVSEGHNPMGRKETGFKQETDGLN